MPICRTPSQPVSGRHRRRTGYRTMCHAPLYHQSGNGHALDRSAHYLREALSVWLSTGEEIHYSAEDSDILTAIGFRPDAASRVDNQEKYTPAQSLIYARRRTELASK
nr:phage polarity suppression protein [Klebsiella variicola]